MGSIRGNLAFVVAAAVCGGLGGLWVARASGPDFIARAPIEVGGRFVRGPLEPLPVAQHRLRGALLAQSGVHEVQIQPSDTASDFELQAVVHAQTATGAEVALQRGVEPVLAEYTRWHAKEVASQERVQARLSDLGLRLDGDTPLGLSPQALEEERDLNTQRLHGTGLVLETLAQRPPGWSGRIEASSPGGEVRPSAVALGAILGVLWALLVLWGAGPSLTWGVVSGLFIGGLGVAGDHQARSAPSTYVGQAVLRIAQLRGEPVPAHPPARKKLHGWVAMQVRGGGLPGGVRFSVNSVAGQQLGLFELKGEGEDPAAIEQLLRAATDHMLAWHTPGVRAGLLTLATELRTQTERLRLDMAGLDSDSAPPGDPAAVRRVSDGILALARTERDMCEIRSGPSELLEAPRVTRADHSDRRLPFVLAGMVCAALWIRLVRRWRAMGRSAA